MRRFGSASSLVVPNNPPAAATRPRREYAAALERLKGRGGPIIGVGEPFCRVPGGDELWRPVNAGIHHRARSGQGHHRRLMYGDRCRHRNPARRNVPGRCWKTVLPGYGPGTTTKRHPIASHRPRRTGGIPIPRWAGRPPSNSVGPREPRNGVDDRQRRRPREPENRSRYFSPVGVAGQELSAFGLRAHAGGSQRRLSLPRCGVHRKRAHQ